MDFSSLFSRLFPWVVPLSERSQGRRIQLPDNQPKVEPIQIPEKIKLDDENSAINPFENLPAEILAEIFSKFDLPSLKACRLVCKQWNEIIYTKPLFLSRVCVVYRNTYSPQISTEDIKVGTTSENLKLQIPDTIFTENFRLRHIYSRKNKEKINCLAWMTSEVMANVTHFDIRASHILFHHFVQIISQIENMMCLSFGDQALIYDAHESAAPSGVAEESHLAKAKQILGQIKTLRIFQSSLNQVLQVFDRHRMMNFGNLVEVDIQSSCDSRPPPGNFFEIGAMTVEILRNNGKTLKRLRLDAYPGRVEETLEKTLADSVSSHRDELYSEFTEFLAGIHKLGPSLRAPHLEFLSLVRFPVANLNDRSVDTILVPFFRKMTKLQEIRLGRAYFSTDSQIKSFVNIFPPSCKIYLESVHLHAPEVDTTDIYQVLHSHQHILKYRRSFVLLQLDNLTWKINFCTWRSLENTIVHDYLNWLQKLKFSRLVFPIRDQEIQLIIAGGQKLTHLHFEHCDLSEVSDSGLTGLKSEACRKIGYWLTSAQLNNYKIRPEDLVFLPLSQLKDLRSLKLSNVGGLLTDVSAKVAFKGMNQLKELIIHQKSDLGLSPSIVDELNMNPGLTFEYKQSLNLDD